jgi:predicted HicB family RNase H-like nuclease
MANVNIRIPDELHEELRVASQEDQRSLNGEILWLLRQALDNR